MQRSTRTFDELDERPSPRQSMLVGNFHTELRLAGEVVMHVRLILNLVFWKSDTWLFGCIRGSTQGPRGAGSRRRAET